MAKGKILEGGGENSSKGKKKKKRVKLEKGAKSLQHPVFPGGLPSKY